MPQAPASLAMPAKRPPDSLGRPLNRLKVSRRLQVPPTAVGERLDRFLGSLPEVGSRAEAERLLAAGAVRVNGELLPKSHRLQGGELLEIEVPEQAGTELEPEERELRIAYEDDHLLVVDKPAGLVVHPSAGHGRGTLVNALLERGIAGGDVADRPGIVHRLDRETSGLLVVARSQEAYERLQKLVRERELDRRYIALVRGRPRSRTGRIEAPIGRDRHDPLRHSLDTDTPREAITHFEVMELLPEHALLSVRLETGRTHQIRVHLQAIELPVVGDPVYGVPDSQLRRQFLHANRLSFQHPLTGEEVDVESPLPDELQAALERFAS
jgi:23S rRNA pseudouridine1911/1915/1917 synthase